MENAKYEVTNAELCALLGVTRNTVKEYVKAGLFKPLRYGVYDAAVAVPAVCAYLRKSSAGVPTSAEADADRARIIAAKAEMAEMELARQKGELWRRDHVIYVFGGQMTNTRARLLALPTRAAPALLGCQSVAEIAAKLRDEVHSALEELSESRGAEDVARQTDASLDV
jgi:phage terminase Nu1 subunit (DNA packaging protein)